MDTVKKYKNSFNIWIVLYLYWFVLLLWQNLRNVSNRSGVDTVIKIALLFILIAYYFFRCHFISVKILIISIILLICSVIQMLLNQTMQLGMIVYYIYPVILFFLTYGVGGNFQINRKNFLIFCDIVILTIWYIVIYAIIFCRDQFINAFVLSTAYGNELSSFLTSNFEYGLYLSFGIMFSLLSIELNLNCKKSKRFYYIFTIIIFIVNLILTFSRTSIIGFLVMFVTYILFYKKSHVRRFFLFIVVVGVIAYFSSSSLQNFLTQIVFKGNANSGRNDLTKLGIQLYFDGNLLSKTFGMTYDTFSNYVKDLTGHSSLHNAYIQTLLTNGWKGIIFLISVIVVELHNNIKSKKNIKINKSILKIFCGFIIASCVFMLTTTGNLFASSIDSYFMTICAIIIPKYVRNSINSGTFDLEEGE